MKESSLLRLGYSALSNWEIMMIKEGFISGYADELSIDEITNTAKHSRIDNKKFLLFSLVLFDKIDASHLSMFNMDKLIDLGIVDEHAHMIEDKIANMDETSLLFFHLEDALNQDNTKLLAAKEIAEEIMIANKSKIVRAIAKQENLHEYDYFDEQEIAKNYTKWLWNCERWASADFNNAKETMGILKESIMYGLYDSITSGAIYYDGSISNVNVKPIDANADIAKNISQIMNIDLSPELYHLPIPSTVSEAIELRKRPEIASFRNVFFEWCDAIKQCDIDMAQRIKSDVRKAQEGLDKYYKWEKSKIKLFNCIIDAVVSQIPYLANIVGCISPFQTRNILRNKAENSWIFLLR